MIRNCKEFQVPTDWMLDNGIISKVTINIAIAMSFLFLFTFYYYYHMKAEPSDNRKNIKNYMKVNTIECTVLQKCWSLVEV